MSLESLADELYALTPQEFTAARNARAKECDDKDLAAAVRRLARPAASAWAVNALVRAHPSEIARMRAVGAELREAQRTLDRDGLRELTGERRTLVGALAGLAGAIATEQGHPLSPSARTEVEQTLLAGLSDEAAADAVASGRLLRPLAPVGFDPVDLDGAVAVPESGVPARSPWPAQAVTPDRTARDERKLAEARQSLGDAEQLIADAAAEVDALDRREERARGRRDRLMAELDELRREADRVRENVAAADDELREVDRGRERARRAAAEAAKAADRARERVKRLS